MKTLTTILLCGTLAGSPAIAQAASYSSPSKRYSQSDRDAAVGAGLTALIIGGIGYCLIWGCSSSGSSSSGYGVGSGSSRTEYYIEHEPAPKPEAPLPSYTAPIGGETGLYGSDHSF